MLRARNAHNQYFTEMEDGGDQLITSGFEVVSCCCYCHCCCCCCKIIHNFDPKILVRRNTPHLQLLPYRVCLPTNFGVQQQCSDENVLILGPIFLKKQQEAVKDCFQV